MSMSWWWVLGQPAWRLPGRSAGRVLIRWWWIRRMRSQRRGGHVMIIFV
jgi:hypothetical protein